MKKTFIYLSVFLTVVLSMFSNSESTYAAATEEPYKIGITGALTGPSAISLAPSIEGFKLYIQKVNDEGGIEGRNVRVMVEDDRAEPPRAASNVRKFVGQGVHLVINMSTSATFLATEGEAKKGNIPVIFTFISPQEADPPKPDPLFYTMGCTNTSKTVPTIMPLIVKELSGGKPAKFGILGVDIPLSRIGAEYMRQRAEALGIKTMVKIIPLATVDITPVALQFIDWGADFIHHWGPGPYTTTLYDAMAKMGWKGKNIHTGEMIPFEDVRDKYKGNPNYIFNFPYVPLFENLPEHKTILSACEKYKATSINSNLILGWENGRVIAQILKRTAWPVSTEKLVAVMENLELDRRPLMGPLKWSKKDHVGPSYWRAYQWKGDRIMPATPWFVFDPLSNASQKVNDLKEIK
jgi:ABC-type branched-subunit amino acid transport system substrate-binding protein